MKIEFLTAGDYNFAMNPQIEKRGDKRLLRMSQRGCTHFLLFSSPLNIKMDIQDAQLQKTIEELADTLKDANEIPLMGNEAITVSCIDYMAYRKENECIDIPDKAANYAICGCLYQKEEDIFNVLLPTAGMGYRCSVAVEIRYALRPYVKQIKKLFRTETQRTPFYEARFEKKNSYVDGSIVYTVGKAPYRYPITEQMLGRTILIRTDGEIPQFKSTTDGVILKQE